MAVSTTLGWIRQEVIDWIGNSDEPYTIDRAINSSIINICNRFPFGELNTSATATPDSGGLIDVPPRCLEIIDIVPVSDNEGVDYRFTGERRRQGYPRSVGYKYRSAGIHREHLAKIIVEASSGSATLVQASGSTDNLAETHIGRELVFDGGRESYNILTFTPGAFAEITIWPEYRFGSNSAITGFIRPQGTHILKLYDSGGNIYGDEVVIDYREKHPFLVGNNDALLIPASRSVMLNAVKNMLRYTKYDVDAERLQLDIIEAEASECKQAVQSDSSQGCGDSIFAPKRRRYR